MDQSNKVLSLQDKKNVKLAKIIYTISIISLIAHFCYISLVYSFFDWLIIFIFTVLFIGPALLANVSMVFLGGGKPIDGGKNFVDGRRLFGDHKTWNGFIKGPLFSLTICYIVFIVFLIFWYWIGALISQAIDSGTLNLFTDINVYKYYMTNGDLPTNMLYGSIRLISLCFGAAIGDLVGSFLKRRLNISEGRPLWIIDQLDLLIFALLFVAIPVIIFPDFLFMHVHVVVFSFILTMSLQTINIIGYKKGIKEYPW